MMNHKNINKTGLFLGLVAAVLVASALPAAAQYFDPGQCPASDIRVINYSQDGSSATVKNISDHPCNVGLAVFKVFERFGGYLETQELFDLQEAIIDRNQTANLSVNLPSCAYQSDLFAGDFPGSAHFRGDRLLDARIRVGNARPLCGEDVPPPPPPPTPRNPTADIKADGQDGTITIPAGTRPFITWSSNDVSSCTVSPTGWTGTSGGMLDLPLSASRTYTVSCTGPYGPANDTVTVNVTQQQAVDADIKANGSDTSTTIAYGASANLTWTSSGATACTVTPGGWTTLNSTGQTTGALFGAQTYNIFCSGPGGQDADSVVVNVESQQQNPPSVTLNANPSFIYQGQSSTLNWTSQNTTSCYASAGPWSGQKSNGSGSESASPSQTSSYTITCTGTNGQTVSANTTITVGTTGCTGPYCGGSGQGYVQVTKSVLNQTFGQSSFSSYAEAQSGDTLVFEIRVRNTGSSYTYVNVRDQLPPELIYVPGSTMMGGFPIQDGIATGGINVGSLNVNEERVITFRATVAQGVGTRLIVNQAFANGNFGSSNVGTANVQIRPRGQVLGAADIVTGPENPIIWTLGLGLVFTLILHLLLSKKLGFSAFPSIGAFLTSTRLERRLRELRRRELKPDAE